MKAKLFAIMLLLFFISLPGYTLSEPSGVLGQKTTAKIDLNKADALSLIGVVKGIGQKRAEAIVKYRAEHGNFSSLEELAKVPGFGKRFVKNHLSQMQNAFAIG